MSSVPPPSSPPPTGSAPEAPPSAEARLALEESRGRRRAREQRLGPAAARRARGDDRARARDAGAARAAAGDGEDRDRSTPVPPGRAASSAASRSCTASARRPSIPRQEGIEGWLWTSTGGTGLTCLGDEDEAPNAALLFTKPLDEAPLRAAFEPEFVTALAARSPLGSPAVLGLLFRVADSLAPSRPSAAGASSRVADRQGRAAARCAGTSRRTARPIPPCSGGNADAAPRARRRSLRPACPDPARYGERQ